jgi:hypothetical protein
MQNQAPPGKPAVEKILRASVSDNSTICIFCPYPFSGDNSTRHGRYVRIGLGCAFTIRGWAATLAR